MRVIFTIASIFALISTSVAESTQLDVNAAASIAPIAETVTSAVTVPAGVGSPLLGAIISENSNGGLTVSYGNFKITCNSACKTAVEAIQQNCQNKGIDCICNLSDDVFWNYVPQCDCINPLSLMNADNLKNLACTIGKNLVNNVNNIANGVAVNNAGTTFATTFGTTFSTSYAATTFTTVAMA